jgi:predicted enzyme related to lactoylglutathione lyase
MASRGYFVWYDLLTRDPDGAAKFYPAVTGWTTEMWKDSPTPYRMWVSPSGPLGGTMGMPPEAPAPPHWLAYTTVPDCAASTKQAQGLGAKLLTGPMDIPQVGKFSVLTDPWGAEFAIFMPANDMPRNAEPQVGEFSWHELTTSDVEGASRFYGEIFGWEKTSAMDMGPDGVYQMFGLGGAPMGGFYRKPPQLPANAWLHYVRVAKLDTALDAAKDRGATITTPPLEVPGGDWVAIGNDPAGARFALHQKGGRN